MVKPIYYTGIGSKKSGNHSVKEFLDIMNKNFNIKCSEFLPDLDYKPCREYKEMNSQTMRYNLFHRIPLFNKKTKKLKTNTSKKYKKLFKQCTKYKKNTKKRKCNLEEYISFSGAEKK